MLTQQFTTFLAQLRPRPCAGNLASKAPGWFRYSFVSFKWERLPDKSPYVPGDLWLGEKAMARLAAENGN